MQTEQALDRILEADQLDYDEPVDRIEFDFSLTRRQMVQLLGAGLLIAVADIPAVGQPPQGRRGGRGRGGGGGRPTTLAARLHLGKDGNITVLTGKVECGQGSRAAAPIAKILYETFFHPDLGAAAAS